MNLLIVIALALFASPAIADECTFPERAPIETGETTQYQFHDSCGEPYEVGYRLDNTTLHFPRGGRHELPEAGPDKAETIFRETYGLIGDTDALIRTKW
ncbi:hypothetical protein [Pararhizobium haloflavum]|uniref:hypothetical protein n=1 Tax=Pararhizobium haloflavum TaxID=2037914 RepID=UPI000C18A842|nr:hypothetical protein [Pararhizobium haloflavum]